MSSLTCSRSESFESIPEADFIKQLVAEQVDDINKSLMTDFKRLELSGKLLPEPLLIVDKSRFVLFPIKHHDVSCFYRLHISIKFEFELSFYVL